MNSKQRLFAMSLAVGIAIAMATPATAQLETPRPSPWASIEQKVGVTDLAITYYRPGVKGRTIWGELVPFGKVWRTGANNATTFSISTDAKIDGHDLAAGKYAIHTIPGKEMWTVIFNSDWDKSGMEYDEAKDVLRVEVKPRAMAERVERMQFAVPELDDDSARVALQWDMLEVSFEVEVPTDAKVLASANAEIEKMTDWRVPFRAASYAFGRGIAQDDAARWIDQSIAWNANYTNLSLKARMLAAAGKTKDAIAIAEKAVAAGKSAEADTSATEKLIEEWKTKK